MARGWESKAVEAQQQDKEQASPKANGVSSSERSRLQKRRTLELARARMAADLKVCASAGHRSMLEQALRALDEQLRQIGQ